MGCGPFSAHPSGFAAIVTTAVVITVTIVVAAVVAAAAATAAARMARRDFCSLRGRSSLRRRVVKSNASP
jgi:hypothetical protein